MKFFNDSHSKSSSKDAMTVAPCFRNAGNSDNSVVFADIVFSMSVFLCLLAAICAINILGIIGIIILSLIICKKNVWKKRTVCQAI